LERNGELQSQLAALKTARDEHVAVLSKDLEALSSQLAALKAARDEHVAVLSKDLEALAVVDAENLKMKEALKKSEAKIDALQDEIATKTVALASTAALSEKDSVERERQLEEAKEQLGTASKEAERLAADVQRLQEEVEKQHRERVATVARLTAEAQQLATAHERQVAELSAQGKAEIDRLRADLERQSETVFGLTRCLRPDNPCSSRWVAWKWTVVASWRKRKPLRRGCLRWRLSMGKHWLATRWSERPSRSKCRRWRLTR
jgi:DNA repair exonuclease SbcCD ATPase subunit